MEIKNCTIKDIDEIFRLYKMASDYQKTKKKVVVWPNFKRELVETEINENRQWKMIIDGEIACLWAITFEDEQIWEEKNKDSAIYIHRITTNSNFRGNRFVAKIVEWAKEYAKLMGKQFVRLDTLGNNVRLIEHYKNAGFEFLGMFNLKNTDNLPEHYHNVPACLFEIDLNK
ncbi:GNAT family N-acetyltransferase [Flavivirga spongiicola]|uniref:GNAT family N-acetyltransferase n=1 Tax=Flavivirga spongiicola TaxID=421621 RepID=A0ABU7XSQ7_9FLAO|nr:GNAT family N-acetyltransferase [Flavivirga sp. MEBiC05379]MDO5978802.1 GNAT family N-acetyltransferase [Flavivirga sp. MEBiC05379]